MVEKVNGFVGAPDQFLSGGIKMFTVTLTNYDMTVLDGLVNGVGKYNKGLEALIVGLSQRAQPVIMGTPTATTLRFAVEHVDVFMDPAAPAANEATALATFATKLQADMRLATGDNDMTVAIAAFAF